MRWGAAKVEVWALPGAGADCASNVPTGLPMVCVCEHSESPRGAPDHGEPRDTPTSLAGH